MCVVFGVLQSRGHRLVCAANTLADTHGWKTPSFSWVCVSMCTSVVCVCARVSACVWDGGVFDVTIITVTLVIFRLIVICSAEKTGKQQEY